MIKSRRTFMITTAGIASGLALSRVAFADAAKVSEADSTAVALGYLSDATRVNKAKYPKYTTGDECRNCTLYQGKSNNAFAPCPIFGGRQVAAKGWCSAYSKKA
ncbi:high-potential iron-sulfur protein [Burkholderia cepacia]|uniref:high-potential iron-sulfur protein n=1 Tax=Burkholderia cepacia TaxID=292 RepID=UPI0020187142|nr:high-potential iron-sulfur protein [Burkholderia cepacia]UQO37819.1 high-potential iron-sulfur protein [Burkholderia cepacia]UQO52157.1 high-potential iron-sulfur protein [Burkholderia cepacia]UQP06304.1 high-potential iron-sulfur protein [Burkholderia cepacia]